MNKITVAIFLLCILSGHSPNPPDLAYVIEGEASTCPIEAKIVVAYMIGRGAKFNGWAEPGNQSIAVSVSWFRYADPFPDAIHWFDEDDLKLPAVQEIVRPLELVGGFECGGGAVHLFG